MNRIALSVSLLLLVALSSPVADADTEGGLRKGEKVVMALLGMVGCEQPAKVAEAKRLWALQEQADMLRPLATALTCRPATLRVFAAAELGALGDERAARPLLHRVVREQVTRVRVALVAALKKLDSPHSAHVLGRALWSRDPTRVRCAADAIGRLGDVAAAPYVIRKWEGRSADFSRVYFTQVNQRSLIRDFDVEVSKTSFITDPIIGVVQPGQVQPVTILATVQTWTGLYRAALVTLAGKDHGRSVKAWRAWWGPAASR